VRDLDASKQHRLGHQQAAGPLRAWDRATRRSLAVAAEQIIDGGRIVDSERVVDGEHRQRALSAQELGVS
jgi:hypothetical protein